MNIYRCLNRQTESDGLDWISRKYYQIMEGQLEDVCCPVCMNTFHRPTTIPCGHTFCLSCLLNATRNQRSCPICRQHFSSTPNKIKPDACISSFLQAIKNTQKKESQQQKPQNIHVQCKEERLILLDITTDDLLLPFNKVSATFELQNGCLIDRLDRFVARQQHPYNKYGVVCRLVHIQQLRRHLFKGVLQGRSFCRIQSQSIDSQVSLDMDEEDFFYRSCGSKQISESSDASPDQYNVFFNYFSKIKDGVVKQQLYQKIDPSILSHRNDPVALFYTILGVLNMPKVAKYELATSFDEERRIQQIQKHISSKSLSLQRNPSSLVKNSEGSNTWMLCLLALVFGFILMSREGLWQDL